MHMACHLRECITDYGPVHGFWLFSFERMNGILQNQPNNNRAVEIQLMRRFLRDSYSVSMLSALPFSEDFSPIFRQLQILPPGSLGEMLTSQVQQALKDVDLPKTYTRCVFDEEELLLLSQLYSQEALREVSVHMNTIFEKYKSITVGGKKFNASRSNHEPIICLARWNESLLGSKRKIFLHL